MPLHFVHLICYIIHRTTHCQVKILKTYAISSCSPAWKLRGALMFHMRAKAQQRSKKLVYHTVNTERRGAAGRAQRAGRSAQPMIGWFSVNAGLMEDKKELVRCCTCLSALSRRP